MSNKVPERIWVSESRDHIHLQEQLNCPCGQTEFVRADLDERPPNQESVEPTRNILDMQFGITREDRVNAEEGTVAPTTAIPKDNSLKADEAREIVLRALTQQNSRFMLYREQDPTFREADLSFWTGIVDSALTAAREAERERCARLADSWEDEAKVNPARWIAAAIRATTQDTKSSAASHNPDGPPASSVLHDTDSGWWNCECGGNNMPYFKQCYGCDRPRPSPAESLAPSSVAGKRVDFNYVQWLRELPDWLESIRDANGGVMFSKKVLDQTIEILRAGIPYPATLRQCNACGHADIAVSVLDQPAPEIQEALEGMVAAFDGDGYGDKIIVEETRKAALSVAIQVLGWATSSSEGEPMNESELEQLAVTEGELLPCPFCGSESVVWSDYFQRVRCNGCFIGTPSISPAHARTDESTAALKSRSLAGWNTRHQPAPARLHCSCGAAVTESEYQTHRARGHDEGAPANDDRRVSGVWGAADWYHKDVRCPGHFDNQTGEGCEDSESGR